MAAETPTSICNTALLRCGGKEITSLTDDNSKEAQLCRRLYHPARRKALASHHWNGAKRAVQLTVNSNITPIFWSYAFTLPTDMVRLITVHPSDSLNASIPYALQNANSTEADNVLLSDSNQIYIQYVFDNMDPNTLSEGFRDVLEFLLARDLCLGLSKSTNKFELTRDEFKRALTLAKSVDGFQDYPEERAQGSWVKARYGLYTDKTVVQS